MKNSNCFVFAGVGAAVMFTSTGFASASFVSEGQVTTASTPVVSGYATELAVVRAPSTMVLAQDTTVEPAPAAAEPKAADDAEAKNKADAEAAKAAEEAEAKRKAGEEAAAAKAAEEAEAKRKADEEAAAAAKATEDAAAAAKAAEEAEAKQKAEAEAAAKKAADEAEAKLKAEQEAAAAAKAAEDAKIQQAIESCRDALNAEIKIAKFSFESEGWEVPRRGYAALNKVAKVAKDCGDVVIEVGGHTDAYGTDASNKRISQLRAESVAAYLRSEGVEGGKLKAAGYGEANPVASNDTSEGRRQNRRIEFLVSAK